MELKYCDDCGIVLTDVTMSQGCPDKNPNCTHCHSEACSKPEPQVQKAPSSPSPSMNHEDALELFSEDTLKLKKSAPESSKKSPPTTVMAPEKGDFELPENENLEFFSEQTLAFKNSKNASSKKKRSQFSCAHCSAKLEIRPVTKLSKLICPKCSQQMYVDPVLGVSKTRPQNTEDRSIEISAPKTEVPNFQVEEKSSSYLSFEEKLQEFNPPPPVEKKPTKDSESNSSPSSIGENKKNWVGDHTVETEENSPAPDFHLEEPPSSFPTSSTEKTENFLAQENAPSPNLVSIEGQLTACLEAPTAISEPKGSAGKQLFYAFFFAFSLTLPILATTLLIDLGSTNQTDLGTFDAWAAECLESLGKACEKAFGKIFS